MEKRRGNVVVYSDNIIDPPLVDSDRVQMIVIKDVFGDPMIILVRMLGDDMWGLCTKSDPDWEEMLVKYGLKRLRPDVPLPTIIEKGVKEFIV